MIADTAGYFALSFEIAVKQLADEKQRAIDRARMAAFWAGNGFADLAFRRFLKQGAFVAAKDGHGAGQ